MTQEKGGPTLNFTEFGIASLPEQFLEKMNRIKAQRAQVELYTADVDLLVRNFDVEKSLFGRAASVFSSLTWWQESLIGIAVAGLFSLIGLAFSLAAVIALPVVALIVYGLMTYLFEEYNQSDINRFAQLSEGVIEREIDMKESVLELQATENELYELIEELSRLGQSYAGITDQFNEQAQLLTVQVQRHDETVWQFAQLKTAFKAHTESMLRLENDFSVGLNQIETQVYQQFERIKRNTDEVEQAAQRLDENIASLKDESLILSIEGNPSQSDRFDHLLNDFHFRTEEDRQKDEERLMRTNVFLEETDAYLLDIDKVLCHYETVNQRHLAAIQKPECIIGIRR